MKESSTEILPHAGSPCPTLTLTLFRDVLAHAFWKNGFLPFQKMGLLGASASGQRSWIDFVWRLRLPRRSSFKPMLRVDTWSFPSEANRFWEVLIFRGDGMGCDAKCVNRPRWAEVLIVSELNFLGDGQLNL